MEVKDRIIYLTRDSFCMADDCTAPNLYRFMWRDCDWSPETDIYSIIEKYLYPGLRSFYWRGFVGGQWMVDVNIHREERLFSRVIVLSENWQELLRKHRCIHFLHAMDIDKDELPTSIDDNYYTFEEAEQLFNDYPWYAVDCIPKGKKELNKQNEPDKQD